MQLSALTTYIPLFVFDNVRTFSELRSQTTQYCVTVNVTGQNSCGDKKNIIYSKNVLECSQLMESATN